MRSVAIPGLAGSYSEEAALTLLGRAIDIRYAGDVLEAIRSVVSGDVDCGLFPTSNSIIGEIVEVTQHLKGDRFELLDEIEISIGHVLAGTLNSSLEYLSSIRSHPAALAQCSKYLATRPHIEIVPEADTASAVRKVSASGSDCEAAIGSRRAAEIYGAKILCDDIADRDDNRTRFVLVRQRSGRGTYA